MSEALCYEKAIRFLSGRIFPQISVKKNLTNWFTNRSPDLLLNLLKKEIEYSVTDHPPLRVKRILLNLLLMFS